jgi:tetratricopeptide (TPR) repeat protein
MGANMSGRSSAVVISFAVLAVVASAAPARADWQAGRDAFDRGSFEVAAEHFAATVKTNPNWAGGHLMLGRALSALERHDEAIEHLKAALILTPGDATATIALARALLAAKRHDEARDLLAKADAASLPAPMRTEVDRLQGQALVASGRTDEAVAGLRARLVEDPDNPALHRTLAAILLEARDRPAALDHLARAFALDPTDQDSGRAAVTGALAAAGASDDVDERVALYARALPIAVALATAFPDAENAILAGEAALGASQLEVAATWFAAAVATTPDDPVALFYLGRTLTLLNRDGEALPHLEKALTANPDTTLAARVHDQLARVRACRLELGAAARHARAAGNEPWANEIDSVANDSAAALERLAKLSSTLAELERMQLELVDLNDRQGIEVVAGRMAAMAREKEAIEANLAEVRRAFCR